MPLTFSKKIEIQTTICNVKARRMLQKNFVTLTPKSNLFQICLPLH